MRVPAVLDVLPGSHTLLLEPVGGIRLDALSGADLSRGLEALGRGLAVLHHLPAVGLPRFTRVAPERLEAAAAIVSAARPEVAEQAHALAAMLVGAPPEPRAALVHGDVHLKNAMLDSDALGLLDFDQLAVGHPAADLGSVVAFLRHATITGALPPEAAEELERAFLTGYRGAGGVADADPVRWHAAAALLAERALRAVTRVLPTSLTRLDTILAEGVALAAGATVGRVR